MFRLLYPSSFSYGRAIQKVHQFKIRTCKNSRPLMRLCHVFLVVFSDIFLDIYEGGKNKAYFMQETVSPLNLVPGVRRDFWNIRLGAGGSSGCDTRYIYSVIALWVSIYNISTQYGVQWRFLQVPTGIYVTEMLRTWEDSEWFVGGWTVATWADVIPEDYASRVSYYEWRVAWLFCTHFVWDVGSVSWSGEGAK